MIRSKKTLTIGVMLCGLQLLAWTAGATALHKAAGAGNLSGVQKLLEEGADVEAVTIDGSTPLHKAAASFSPNAPRVVQMLREAGANIKAVTIDDWTLLHSAATSSSSNAPQVVQILLEAGVDIKAVTKKNGWTPLHSAARHSSSRALLQALLEGGADVETRDANGWTALHIASRHGYTDLVRVLLKAGADREVQANHGFTPLQAAEAGNHREVMQLLATSGPAASLDTDSHEAMAQEQKNSEDFSLAISSNPWEQLTQFVAPAGAGVEHRLDVRVQENLRALGNALEKQVDDILSTEGSTQKHRESVVAVLKEAEGSYAKQALEVVRSHRAHQTALMESAALQFQQVEEEKSLLLYAQLYNLSRVHEGQVKECLKEQQEKAAELVRQHQAKMQRIRQECNMREVNLCRGHESQKKYLDSRHTTLQGKTSSIRQNAQLLLNKQIGCLKHDKASVSIGPFAPFKNTCWAKNHKRVEFTLDPNVGPRINAIRNKAYN